MQKIKKLITEVNFTIVLMFVIVWQYVNTFQYTILSACLPQFVPFV